MRQRFATIAMRTEALRSAIAPREAIAPAALSVAGDMNWIRSMAKSGQGIELTGRNEQQPIDKERAQDPSSSRQDKEQGNIPDGQTKKREV